MFTCRGCEIEYDDKDFGALISYYVPKGTEDNEKEKVNLLFCGITMHPCWIPTSYFMLENMNHQERVQGWNVLLQVSDLFDVTRDYRFINLEIMLDEMKKITEKTPIQEMDLVRTLHHYETIGVTLAQGDYKRSSESDTLLID